MSNNDKAMKEILSLLKNLEYDKALKKCRILLKKDTENYAALVLIGDAMSGIDEHKEKSPIAYKKAIGLHPDNPAAWRRLVTYYENEPYDPSICQELIPAYCKLLHLKSNSSKFSHYLDQAVKYSIILNDNEILDEVLSSLRELRKNKEIKKPIEIDEALEKIFSSFPKFAKKYTELHGEILANIIQNDGHPFHYECYNKYLKFLFTEMKYDDLFVAAKRMHEFYPGRIPPLEWICRVYAEQTVLNKIQINESITIEEIYEKLLKLHANSYFAAFAKAIHLWKNNHLIEARDCLNQVVLLEPKKYCAWIALSEINATLHCWSEVESASESALDYIDKSIDLRKRVHLLLIESRARMNDKQKWALAAQICEEILIQNPSDSVKLLYARVRVHLKDPSVDEYLDELAADPKLRTEVTILRALSLKLHESYEEAIDVLGSVLETSEAWKIYGEINWKISNYSHSHMAFLKSVRADPYDWECFIYLGHYYRDHGKNLEKSQKCYQKALCINSNSDEAGSNLSTIYRLLKNTEANMQMLQQVTSAEGGGPKWAWLQLGLQQLDQGEIAQAITSLRYVIRADPNDNHCWESLADAYLMRGAHTSALKSYQRALQLSPGSLYPMIQLANIKLVLGRFNEAKKEFTQVLSQEQHYIPAIKGLAETCLGIAKENASKQLLGRVQRNVQQAVDCLTDAIIINSNLSCIWKLFGDACYYVAILPDIYCHLDITPGLVKSDSKKERIEIYKSELFTLSARCYCRALTLSNESALVWHDLACCYLSQLHLDPSVNRKLIAEKSLAAAKQAVKLCPTTWVHWNILGVVCMTNEIKNYALAQHCWVMAIDNEPNNAIACTNLGTLYLHLGDYLKANEAFSRAQRADPDYQNSWIGQGLLAEFVGSKEARILFRHATELGYHPQAAIGYGHMVLSMILDPQANLDPLYTYIIVNMHAIPVATDAMTWYIEREPNDVCGRNSLGLLLERQKLLRSASHQFSEALRLCKGQRDIEDKVRVNLARVLVQMEKHNEAIQVCQGIKNVSFNSHCQLALALFKAARYEESYAAYEAALHQLADAESDKAHVLCAMAAMAYMFQDIDDVKTLLFQCIQIQPPSVAGLLAAAALGLLHNDYNLTSLVLKELEPYEDDPNYRHHVAILSAHLYLQNEDCDGAYRVLGKAIHRRPDDVRLWVGLVRVLLEQSSRNLVRCALKALYFGRKNSATTVAEIACISSFSKLDAENAYESQSGLRSVQKNVHSFPGNIESWANLVVVLYPRCNGEDTSSIKNARWLSKLISIVRGKLKTTESMNNWLLMNEKKIEKMLKNVQMKNNE